MPRMGVTSYDVLVSCPGDVNEFMETIKKSFENFNRLFGVMHNINLNMKHWITDSYPESGNTPQKLLNRQLVHECDMAIALFWTRFGSPTKEYKSGTEEEIAIMLENKKQVFVYFLDIPIKPSKIDWYQYNKVKEFQTNYKEEGIYSIIDSTDQLRQEVYNHLILHFWDKMTVEKTKIIIFNSNGGSEITNKTVPYNEPAYEPIPPTRPGYKFCGWYTDTGLSNQFDFTKPIVENVLLYAKWEMFSYTISDGNATITGLADLNYSGPLILPSKIIDGTYSYRVVDIAKDAFNGCRGLTGPLTIPDGVTSIGYSAFSYCSGLTGALTIPDSVTSIGSGAFHCCSGLTGTLTIPDSVTSIGGGVFHGCNLTDINVSNQNPVFSSKDGILYDKVQSSLLAYPTGRRGQINIPDSVTSIGDHAFSNCRGLTGPLRIPDSVTNIGNLAFSDCSGLTGHLTIPDSVISIGNFSFSGCEGLTGLTIGNRVESIGDYAFSDCSGLAGPLTIPDSVTILGIFAFYCCRGLTGLTIGNRVKRIGDSAFSACFGLTGTLRIPNSVFSIGESVFEGCSGLSVLTFREP